MNWIFIITRDNVVESCKVFTDYFEGEQFTNNFIKKIHPSTTDFPEYRKGLFFENEGLRVSLYKDGFGDSNFACTNLIYPIIYNNLR